MQFGEIVNVDLQTMFFHQHKFSDKCEHLLCKLICLFFCSFFERTERSTVGHGAALLRESVQLSCCQPARVSLFITLPGVSRWPGNRGHFLQETRAL